MNKQYPVIITKILICMLLPCTVLAQTIDLGLKSGASVSFRDITKNNEFVPMPSGAYPLFAYTGGLTLNLKFSDRWSFHSEVLYVDKGIRGQTHQDSLQDQNDNWYYADWTQYSWNHSYYLNFPQTLRYEIPLTKNDKWFMYFELGGYFACYLRSKAVIETYSIQGNSSSTDNFDEISRIESSGNTITGPQTTIHRFDWGGTAGLGFLFNLWKGTFDLNIRYDHDIQPHLSFEEPVKTRVFSEVLSLTVGYSLPVLNRKIKNY
jgi:hypothetical protein